MCCMVYMSCMVYTHFCVWYNVGLIYMWCVMYLHVLDDVGLANMCVA